MSELRCSFCSSSRWASSVLESECRIFLLRMEMFIMNLVSLLYRTFSSLGPLRAIAHTSQFRSFYLEPVYRLIPIFNPSLMAALLVSFSSSRYPLHQLSMNGQLFKILSPFVFLSAAFATLNGRLGMPPFALFLVALSLTDGAPTYFFVYDYWCNMLIASHVVMTMTFFFNVTDTGKKVRESSALCPNPFT